MNQERNFIPDSKFQVPKTSIPYGNLDLVCPYDAVDPTSTYHPYFLQSLSGSRVYDASPRYISVLMRVPIYVLIHNCDSYILQASHGLIPSCKLQGLSLPTASLVTFYLKKGFYGLIRLTLNLQTVEEIEKSKCETGF